MDFSYTNHVVVQNIYTGRKEWVQILKKSKAYRGKVRADVFINPLWVTWRNKRIWQCAAGWGHKISHRFIFFQAAYLLFIHFKDETAQRNMKLICSKLFQAVSKSVSSLFYPFYLFVCLFLLFQTFDPKAKKTIDNIYDQQPFNLYSD